MPNHSRLGSIPLTVTIHGSGPATGKTRLQFVLAEFLSSRGHRVLVSDTSTSEDCFNGCLKRHRDNPPDKPLMPMPVYLHVGAEKKEPWPLAIDGQAPKEWM